MQSKELVYFPPVHISNNKCFSNKMADEITKTSSLNTTTKISKPFKLLKNTAFSDIQIRTMTQLGICESPSKDHKPTSKLSLVPNRNMCIPN